MEDIEDKYQKFNRIVYELDFEFTIRTLNCFYNEDIFYIGDLVKKSEQDLLNKVFNLGHRSFKNIKEVLAENGLSLNMDVSSWERPIINTEQLQQTLHRINKWMFTKDGNKYDIYEYYLKTNKEIINNFLKSEYKVLLEKIKRVRVVMDSLNSLKH